MSDAHNNDIKKKSGVNQILFNFIVGFVLPWTIAILICRRVPLLFLTVAPFISLISITCNQLGMEIGFWTLHPQTELLIFNSVNIDFGFNPATGLLFIYMIYFGQWKRWRTYLVFLLILNGAELTALYLDKVRYAHGWNIFFTFITYGIGLIILDLYFNLLKKSIHRFKLEKKEKSA